MSLPLSLQRVTTSFSVTCHYLFHCNVCHGTSAAITVLKSALLIFLFFSTQQNCLQMDQKPHCIVHKDDYFHSENNITALYVWTVDLNWHKCTNCTLSQVKDPLQFLLCETSSSPAVGDAWNTGKSHTKSSSTMGHTRSSLYLCSTPGSSFHCSGQYYQMATYLGKHVKCYS